MILLHPTGEPFPDANTFSLLVRRHVGSAIFLPKKLENALGSHWAFLIHDAAVCELTKRRCDVKPSTLRAWYPNHLSFRVSRTYDLCGGVRRAMGR
jgi:hypothetical protein